MAFRLRFLLLGFLAFIVTTPSAMAQQNFDAVQIEVVDVAPSVYMLIGRGGNIGLAVGEDGAFIVDDQYAPLTEKILAAVKTISDQPVRFVVNTHWHGDHTGGNENMGAAGAIVVAHENVRTRMSSEHFNEVFNRTTPPSPEGALPVITFTDAMTFHWNGDDIHVFHVEHAHTDGDAILHWAEANVVHMGDTYFNGMYPFIDVSSAGTIDGVIAAADKVLAMSDSQTKIIPGHGALSNKAELQTYRDMLATVRDRVAAMIRDGKSKEEVVAANPTSDFDPTWGGGFMEPDVWIGLVYASLADR